MLGELKEWLTGLPDWLDPSPKFQEYENGGVPPVGVAVKTVVRGVTAVGPKSAQKVGGTHPMV